MIGLLVQAMSQAVFSNILLTIVDDLGSGALNGLLAGAAIGAIVWTVNKAPDTLGRIMLFTIVLALLMTLVQLILILSTLPEVSFSSLMIAFQDRSSEIGQQIVTAGNMIALSAIGGALVAATFSAPGEAIRGALIGLFLGALLGGILNVALKELRIGVSRFIFQLIVGLLTWGSLSSVGGR